MFFSLFSCAFSKINIYYNHSNTILLSKRLTTQSPVSQKYRPSHFRNQQFLYGRPELEFLQGQPEIWKVVDHLGAKPLETHCLVSQWDLYKQCVPPSGSLTYFPAMCLHVTRFTQVLLMGREPVYYVMTELVTRCNETWRQLRCVLLMSHHRVRSAMGRSILKHLGSFLLMAAFAWLFFPLCNFIWNSGFSLLPDFKYFLRDFK